MTEPALQATGVAAGYHGAPAIINLDLEVRAGEVVALLGANGAGKTTTIRALSGQLPLLAGSVRCNGTDKPGPLHRRIRNGMGLLTENRCLFMALTCRENLRLGKGSIDAALRYFPELEDRLDVRAGLISGGEQQMLALARIVAAEPKVLLADELSSGLAPIVVRRLLRALSDAAKAGAAVLIVEQHARVALRAADRAYILHRGRIELSGATADLRAREEEVKALYL